jgi:hypothetical protein
VARTGDPKAANLVNLYREIMRSVPTVMEPGTHGPLTEDGILDAAARMDQLGAEVKATREQGEPAGTA